MDECDLVEERCRGEIGHGWMDSSFNRIEFQKRHKSKIGHEERMRKETKNS